MTLNNFRRLPAVEFIVNPQSSRPIKRAALIDEATMALLPIVFQDKSEAEEFAIHCDEKNLDLMQVPDANMRLLYGHWRKSCDAAA